MALKDKDKAKATPDGRLYSASKNKKRARKAGLVVEKLTRELKKPKFIFRSVPGSEVLKNSKLEYICLTEETGGAPADAGIE